MIIVEYTIVFDCENVEQQYTRRSFTFNLRLSVKVDSLPCSCTSIYFPTVTVTVKSSNKATLPEFVSACNVEEYPMFIYIHIPFYWLLTTEI